MDGTGFAGRMEVLPGARRTPFAVGGDEAADRGGGARAGRDGRRRGTATRLAADPGDGVAAALPARRAGAARRPAPAAGRWGGRPRRPTPPTAGPPARMAPARMARAAPAFAALMLEDEAGVVDRGHARGPADRCTGACAFCGPLGGKQRRRRPDRDRGRRRDGAPARGRVDGSSGGDRGGASALRVILPGPRLAIVIATRPVDVRRGRDGPAATVRNELGLGPRSAPTAVFRVPAWRPR